MSGNLLNARPAEVLSDVPDSEAGTSVSGRTSWDSREELRDLVTMLGLQKVEDLYQERFRVDRKKLEHMLLGDNEAPEPADTFFYKIMEDTNTFITWPSRLKIGAKSKKDPHVRIAGRPEDVRIAKDKIMSVLDTRSNRVTMKLDVSYTDHSHIIGKGGLCIKRVMEETQCHIHFPDSNRSNPTEKSNQVSIAGEIEGVEKARSRVRKLTPLIFSFELPILSSSHPTHDTTSPYVIHVQETYNVQVMFRTRPKLHATLVLVKGVEWEVQKVKQATLVLIDYMCDTLASQILVQMSMEISPQHHPVVLGKGSGNLKTIMQQTNTQIMFPDANDPNIPTIKKSNVTITGTIHNVYFARQQLMGSLPLVLMFDLPEQTKELPTDPESVAKIMTVLDVFINIRHKPKQNTLSVIIKGIERRATNIYEARNRLLGVSEPRIVAEIPSTYLCPVTSTAVDNNQNNHTQLKPQSPNQSNLLSSVWPYAVPHYNHNQFNSQNHTQTQPQPQAHNRNIPNQNQSQNNHHNNFVGMVPQQRFVYNLMHGSIGSSGYHSSFGQYSNTSSLDQSQECGAYSSISSGASSGISSPISSPRNNSPSSQNNNNDSADSLELSSVFSDLSISEQRRAPGFEKRSHDPRQNLTPADYDQKRVAGVRAMQSKPLGGYRIPTNIWSGYGISHTSPGAINIDKCKPPSPDNDDDIWKTPTNKLSPASLQFSTTVTDYSVPSTSATPSLNTSNYMDHTPRRTLNNIISSKWSDLASLLASLDLEKYIGLFSSHEIDLSTFPSLTDRDLVEIGVTAFGARRKMLLVISELNKRSSPFSGSAAPGAERKSSSSTLSNSSSPRDGW